MGVGGKILKCGIFKKQTSDSRVKHQNFRLMQSLIDCIYVKGVFMSDCLSWVCVISGTWQNNIPNFWTFSNQEKWAKQA